MRWSRSAVGRLPRRAQRRVSMVFWPTRASSCHQISIAVLAGSLARICPNPAGKFFKILDGKLVLPLVAWSRRYLAKPQRPQFTAHRRLINRNAELFEYPMRQVLSAPTHDTVDRRNRSALNKPSERLSLPVIELGRLACRLAVNQTIRPLGVETENPVTDHLEPDSTDPRRLRATATIVNLSQRKKPPALSSILRRLG